MLLNSNQLLAMVLLISTFFSGCSSNQHEKYFIEKANKLLEENSTVETSFESLTDFEWDKVCFGYLEPTMTFYSDNDVKQHLELSRDQFYIQEDYVKGSPSEKCFAKSQVFIFQIKKINSSNKILVQYKKDK